ncbi:unnamed protein product [Linum trigynum]|uniref:Protein FAR1-RELATED SEQUENCE n=1 Tax=Linum trigynum TaxID=586398 RepID=A0AAV2G983_9ROSI
MLKEKREIERLSDYNAINRRRYVSLSRSPLAIEAANTLAPNVFTCLQKEHVKVHEYKIRKGVVDLALDISNFLVFKLKVGERVDERIVRVHFPTTKLECECRLYNCVGYPCVHILKVMDFLSSAGYESMRTLPDHFHLPRWRKDVKENVVRALRAGSLSGEELSPTGNQSERYREISGKLHDFVVLADGLDDEVYDRCFELVNKFLASLQATWSKRRAH